MTDTSKVQKTFVVASKCARVPIKGPSTHAVLCTNQFTIQRTIRARHFLFIFAFGRLQSSLPKALKPRLAPTPLDFIEIGYLKASYDTFADY
jgi:hypothetical protein